ncbi:hypothetical protein [Luteimicrobium subarcticum]|uniref:Uncharacterized protein n=1 Tax=Luteimicrobium subarcticum TaxID=620910 RepID=A0A2M8WRF3_9MICO|nr:hypothetical protein [Luteimicrobium subarcticum]PJI93517.1 hypothetical protein CLV34_2091 [Luteimicrobium subarcticum]
MASTKQGGIGWGGKVAIGVVVAVVGAVVLVAAAFLHGLDEWADANRSLSVPVPGGTTTPDGSPGPGSGGAADRAGPEGDGPEVAPGNADQWHGTAAPDGPLPADDVVASVARLPWDPSAAGARAAGVAAVERVVPAGTLVQAELGDDALVVTAGVPGTSECVVVVRPAQGKAFLFSDFDRILLAPGEGGCAPYLYLAPVTTH